jgi:glycerol uptake facilitator-like aquaporin
MARTATSAILICVQQPDCGKIFPMYLAETIMNFLAILVEFLGTFIFLSVIVATGNPWAIGATLAVLAFLGGSISGGHFNPAVTIMTLYNRGIATDNAAAYIVAQIVAGILAVVVYKQIKLAGVF